MAAKVDDLNVNPNQAWYIKISDAGTQGLVEFFNSEADAEAGINRVAYGYFDFGYAVEVELTNDTADPEIEIFNDYLDYHIKVTLYDGDPTKIFREGPLTDLTEVSDPLLISSQAILDRARREIDEHTHTKIIRDVSLATHLPQRDPGDVIRLRDPMRGLDQLVRIEDITTMGTKDSLLDAIRTVEFKDVKR